MSSQPVPDAPLAQTNGLALVAQLERAAYTQQWAQGAEVMVQLIDFLAAIRGRIGVLNPRPTPEARRGFYTLSLIHI